MARARAFLACVRAQGGLESGSKKKDDLWMESHKFLIFRRKTEEEKQKKERKSLPLFWILEGTEEKRLWCKEE